MEKEQNATYKSAHLLAKGFGLVVGLTLPVRLSLS